MTEIRNLASEVRIGSMVRLRGEAGVDLAELTIVGSRSEQSIDRLHAGTALGAALLGHRKGDKVQVTTDAGTVTFLIEDLLP